MNLPKENSNFGMIEGKVIFKENNIKIKAEKGFTKELKDML
jgi:hypothetical protein